MERKHANLLGVAGLGVLGLAGYYNSDKLPSFTGLRKATPESSPTLNPTSETRAKPEGEAGGLYGDVENGAKDINSKTYRNTTSNRPEDQPNPANEVPLHEETPQNAQAEGSRNKTATPNKRTDTQSMPFDSNLVWVEGKDGRKIPAVIKRFSDENGCIQTFKPQGAEGNETSINGIPGEELNRNTVRYCPPN